MKLQTVLLLLCLVMFSAIAYGQKIKLIEGSTNKIKEARSFNFEFTYDENMIVGKMKESDYVAQKREEYNKQEAGKGDKWASSWVSDRERAYEPKFIKLFTEASKTTQDVNAPYTIIFNTTFTEPGFSVGWPVKKNALITGTATVVETNNKSNVLAKFSVENAPGRMAMGVDFAVSWRIAEAYAMAGRELAKFIR